MRHRCIWSHRQGDDLIGVRLPRTNAFGWVVGEQRVFVAQVHEDEARKFAVRVARYGRLFLALMLLGVVGLIGFSTTGWTHAAGACLVGMGVTAQYLPFATPQTVAMFGIATSIVLARVAGCLLILLGVAIGSGLLS